MKFVLGESSQKIWHKITKKNGKGPSLHLNSQTGPSKNIWLRCSKAYDISMGVCTCCSTNIDEMGIEANANMDNDLVVSSLKYVLYINQYFTWTCYSISAIASVASTRETSSSVCTGCVCITVVTAVCTFINVCYRIIKIKKIISYRDKHAQTIAWRINTHQYTWKKTG